MALLPGCVVHRSSAQGPTGALLVLGLVLGVGGCIVEAPSAGQAHHRGRAEVGGRAAASPAALQVRGGAVFGQKVEVLGATLTPARPQPGDQVHVTLSLRVLEVLPEDYWIFVHVEDPDGKLERINVDHAPAGGQQPTTQWRRGDVVTDEFSFYLPPGPSASSLQVWFGFWQPQRDARLPLSNPEAVRHDGRDRVMLVQVPLGG